MHARHAARRRRFGAAAGAALAPGGGPADPLGRGAVGFAALSAGRGQQRAAELCAQSLSLHTAAC